ncbi:MAG TPA: LacI family DNA-binding transcriptional regulator [Opitutaceae bacterium]|nr:LacI family DNA-binding transcriptional regulator [Opitutaceae bacterium]
MTSKKKPGISLRTLARLAGVSVSTASRALHNHPVISAPVREKIKALARKRGYELNPLVAQVYSEARAGRGFRHLGTLALITSWDTPDWWRAHPTLRGFHDGAIERAKESGLGVDEFWAHEPGLKGRRLTQILRARGIGGVVLAPVPGRTAEGMLEWKYFSSSLIGQSVKAPRLHRAVPDQRHAMQLALRELTRCGYRRIGLVLRRRYHAMTDFIMLSTFLLFQHEIPPADCVPVEAPEEWTRQAFMTWFQKHRPDAIIGAVKPAREWLAEAGCACPRDIGLVLLDWDDEAKEKFAAVDQNASAVGGAAVDMVLSQMRRNERDVPATPQTVLVGSVWRPGATIRKVGTAWTPAFLADEPAGVA